MALRLETALPSGERGPVDFLALRRLAAICFALVAMSLPFTLGPGSSVLHGCCGVFVRGEGIGFDSERAGVRRESRETCLFGSFLLICRATFHLLFFSKASVSLSRRWDEVVEG